MPHKQTRKPHQKTKGRRYKYTKSRPSPKEVVWDFTVLLDKAPPSATIRCSNNRITYV